VHGAKAYGREEVSLHSLLASALDCGNAGSGGQSKALGREGGEGWV